MKNFIPLTVLDEYTKRLTNNQINKLYESKTNKKYTKALNESDNSNKFKLYLNSYIIADEMNYNKAQLIMKLNESNAEMMNEISYKIESDGITFTSNSRESYRKLEEALRQKGLDVETLMSIRDKKY